MKAFTLTVLAAMFHSLGTCDTTKTVTTLRPTYPVQAAAKRIEGRVTATFDDGRWTSGRQLITPAVTFFSGNADGNERGTGYIHRAPAMRAGCH